MKNFFPILVADDDQEDQLMLQDYFNDIDLKDVVKYVDNGQKVIHYLQDLPSESLPKLIILDLNMPILNGIQTLLQLKRSAALKEIPVIIFTTAENDNEKRKCLSYGAIDYLVKPMTYVEGTEIIRKFSSFI